MCIYMVFFFNFFFLSQSCYGGALSLWSSLDGNIKGCFSWKCFMDNLVWNAFMLSCTVNDFDLHLGRITSCVESCSLKSAPSLQPEGIVCYSTLDATTEDWFWFNFIVCAFVILPYTLPSILGFARDCGANSKAAFTPNLFSCGICHSFLMGPLWDSCNSRQCIRRHLYRRLVWRLTLSPAKPFGPCSSHHTKAADQVCRQSDTKVTRRTTGLDCSVVTRYV